MTQIATEDYVNLLIYLHVDTTTQGFDPRLMQQEHRARRRLDASGERNFDPMVSFIGNDPIGGGLFTATLVKLRAGVRIVPVDSPHTLDILNQIVNVDDGLSDRGVFDRSSVASNVDIDSVYSPVEIREVLTSGGDPAAIAVAVWAELLAGTAAENLLLSAANGVLGIGDIVDAIVTRSAHSKRDQVVFDANGNMTARERWFPTNADAVAETNATDTFTVTSTVDGPETRVLQTFAKIRDL